MDQYDLKSVNLPVLQGSGLKLFCGAASAPLSSSLVGQNLIAQGGIPKLREKFLEEAPTFLPLVFPVGERAKAGLDPRSMEKFFQHSTVSATLPYRTYASYSEAYRSGKLSPQEVAESVAAAIRASDEGDKPMHAFIVSEAEDIRRQALASAQRYKEGHPLSLLDGVPVAVKDEVDQIPYPSTVGTSFLGKRPVQRDATVVGRLRAAGALLVGKTNMHEIGINPNGSNAHYGAVRNPFDPAHDTGGSSSGSAAAVAAGICPVAIGADGGGSIRIPAALCGVVGLKPTYGRISETGAAPLCWGVAHLGPIGVSVADVALAYALAAGPDPDDPNSLHQPPVSLAGWNNDDLKGLRIGVYTPWCRHADPEVVACYEAMCKNLERSGAQIKEVVIPELDAMRIAHVIIILSEMAASMRNYPRNAGDFGASVQLTLKLGASFTSSDYVHAQRMRTRAMTAFKNIYEDVDVIFSPASAIPAPLIPVGAEKDGWSNLGADTEMMRYVYSGNLTGLPAISFPGGYTAKGLPVGMQAMGRWWEEHTLLRIAYAAEQWVERRKPQVFFAV